MKNKKANFALARLFIFFTALILIAPAKAATLSEIQISSILITTDYYMLISVEDDSSITDSCYYELTDSEKKYHLIVKLNNSDTTGLKMGLYSAKTSGKKIDVDYTPTGSNSPCVPTDLPEVNSILVIKP